MTPAGDPAGTGATGERLSLALKVGRIGTWYWDMTTGVIDRDAAVDELLGIEPGSTTPSFEEYVARVHPDDRPEMHRAFQHAVAEGHPSYTNEHRIVRPDGTTRWVESKGYLSFDPDGTLTDVIGVLVDVTERRASQAAQAAARAAEDLALRRAGAVERRIALSARAADLLDAPLDLDAALQQVANLAIEVLGDWCNVDLLTEDGIHHVAVAHRDPSMVARARALRERYPRDPHDPTLQRILERLEPLLVEHLDDDLLARLAPDPDYRAAVAEFRLSSFAIVPLVAGGKGIGTLTLAACHGRSLGQDDLDLAVDLGRRAGAAVEKTRLYAELRETSRVLQTSLLPVTLPDIPGLAISAHYRSGTEGMQIGGDFYDVFRTGPDRWWVMVGDVCGKGPAAAALAAAVRYSVRAVAPDTDDPAVVLRRLNELLLDQVSEGQFTSVVLATLVAADPSTSAGQEPGELPAGAGGRGPVSLSVASAGHPPPLLHSADRTVTALPCAGTVLGLFPDVEVALTTVELSTGQVLLFYTDGATEARTRSGSEVGEEGLADLLAGSEVGGTCRAPAIAAALLELTGGALHDDLALLTLAVEPAGPSDH